ncbi:glycosyl transferase family 41-domain-containing protein [Dissophora ornata]|nr:glycosyl transferase family 41-domain-containing protein [Dissophora ornata]
MIYDHHRQGQEQQQQQQQQNQLLLAAAAVQQQQQQQQNHQHHHQQQQVVQPATSIGPGPLTVTKVQLPQTSHLSQMVVQVQLVDGKGQQLVIDAREEEWRDHLLSYAHTLYASEATNPSPGSPLIPVLEMISNFHKSHLPTLLLLACVYYTQRNYGMSLRYNHLILTKDPNYVEAMSNIGTTLRSMGRQPEAESWWWKAVRLRPGYWDAVENLIGVLCSGYGATETQPQTSAGSSATEPSSVGSDPSKPKGEKTPAITQQPPRYKEALKICEFVEANVLPDPSDPTGEQPPPLPIQHTPRLQNLLYAKGNLKYALGDVAGARREYERSLEIVFGPSVGAMQVVNEIMCLTRMAAGYGRPSARELEGAMLLLRPEEALQLTQVVFRETSGVLPGLAALAASCTEVGATSAQTGVSSTLWQQANQTTSTILLTLAKLYQDVMDQPAKAKELAGVDNYVPTMSMLLPLYYLSLALNPSPSTCNNLGILLSSIPPTAKIFSYPAAAQPIQQVQANGLFFPAPVAPSYPITGQALALAFYNYGLQLDPRHPHLYTNLGSLLKDMGQLNEAVAMYEKAVECNPRFDVALANLGNAVKDLGKVQDSIQWYHRAVEINPNFSEAVCGLVNALGGVCDWRGRGGVGSMSVTADGRLVVVNVSPTDKQPSSGWMGRVSEIVEKQLTEGAVWGMGLVRVFRQQLWHLILRAFLDSDPRHPDVGLWQARLDAWANRTDIKDRRNEGGWIIRLLERASRRLQRKWYLAKYGPSAARPRRPSSEAKEYQRPMLPHGMAAPPVPTVLPFHTFTYPLTSRQIRLISHRNALRISHGTLASHWLPNTVYPPPAPPTSRLKIGYVSSDFNNHPLSHLMQSVFGMHDKNRFEVFCYATTPADQTPYRVKIQSEVEHFVEVSTWSTQAIVERVVADSIHVLVNLNGYTKGARNEVFAARPCPVQVSFMGFAGTLGAGWCDWIVADPIVCPPEMVTGVAWKRKQRSLIIEHSTHTNGETTTNGAGPASGGKRRSSANADRDIKVETDTAKRLVPSSMPLSQQSFSDFEGEVDPEDASDDWVYTEKFIYMPHSYFVNDHRQGFREEEKEQEKRILIATEPHLAMSPEWNWILEQDRRWQMRKELFPGLAENTVIFANFNQLYKIDPQIFKVWLQILARVPNSILWLLRFPAAGEPHLLRTANEWAGPSVASRVIFTDVAPKQIHIHRGRIADLFLDTPECNAHTTAADILWSGTPILTFPKYSHKMCSRVGASIAYATGHGNEMVVTTEEEYEERAVQFAQGCRWEYVEDSVLKQKLGFANPMMGVGGLTGTAAAAAVTNGVVGLGHSQAILGVSGTMLAQAQSQIHAGTVSGAARMHPTGGTTSSAHSQFLQQQQQQHQPYVGGQVQPQQIQMQQQQQQQQQQQRQQQQAMAQSQPSVCHWIGHGPLMDLRRKLWENRDRSLLFDTMRWTRNLEKGLCEAWRRWESGQEFDELLENNLSMSSVNGSGNGKRRSSASSKHYHHSHNGNIIVQLESETDMKATDEQRALPASLHSNSSSNGVSGVVAHEGLIPGIQGSEMIGGGSINHGIGYSSAAESAVSSTFSVLPSIHPLSMPSAPSSNGSSTSVQTPPTKKHPMVNGSSAAGYRPSSNGSGGTFAGYGIPEGQIDPGQQHGAARRGSGTSSGGHGMVILKSRVERLDQQIRHPDLGCIFVNDV